jgi:hypothetical protein
MLRRDTPDALTPVQDEADEIFKIFTGKVTEPSGEVLLIGSNVV